MQGLLEIDDLGIDRSVLDACLLGNENLKIFMVNFGCFFFLCFLFSYLVVFILLLVSSPEQHHCRAEPLQAGPLQPPAQTLH